MRKFRHYNIERLPAFTMLELIIAMLVSAIVIATMYIGLKLVVQSGKSYSGRHDEMATILRLDELLRKDVEKADMILLKDDGVEVAIDSTRVLYHFEGQAVVRMAARTDSFSVQAVTPVCSFKGNTVAMGIKPTILDELYFEVRMRGQVLPFRYYKLYSSKELISNAK